MRLPSCFGRCFIQPRANPCSSNIGCRHAASVHKMVRKTEWKLDYRLEHTGVDNV